MADLMQNQRLDAYAQDLLNQSYNANPISPEILNYFGRGMQMQPAPSAPNIAAYSSPQIEQPTPALKPNEKRMEYMNLVEQRFNEIANALGGVNALVATGRLDKARQRAEKDVAMQFGEPPAIQQPVEVLDIQGTRVATGGALKSPIVLPTEIEKKASELGLQKSQFDLEEAQKKLALTQQESQLKNLDRALKLQTALASSADAVLTIDSLLNDPKLSQGVGWNNMMSIFPETQAKELQTKIDKLKGKTFLQAYESLRGASGISNIEGAKAEQAMQRLDPKMNVDQFKNALQELRNTFVNFSQNAASGLQGYLPQEQQQQANTQQQPAMPQQPAQPQSISSPGGVQFVRDPQTGKLILQK